MTDDSALRKALAECSILLGAERVSADAAQLAQVNTATFATESRSTAILKPASRQQVVACLQIAARHQVPIYPVSTGHNWGYGSAVAPLSGCMLLSLADLNAVCAFDASTGRIQLEPGVTFHQLSQYLHTQHAPFQAPHTGSGAHTSVVGNIMERGIGKGLYEDMASHVLACEAVLADGTVLKTDANASGPALFGLLTQSNLAVVVELTLQLEPQPRLSQIITFAIPDGLGGMVQTLRKLHDTARRGAPRLQMAFLNDYRITSQTAQFPHDSLDAHAALPRNWMQPGLALWGGAQWIGACTLWADDADELTWRRNTLCKTLNALGVQARLEPPEDGPAQELDDDGLRCAYWRKTFPMPSQPDLDRDRCGVIWIAPVVPLNAPALVTLIAQLETTTLAHGLEPALAVRTGRNSSVRLILGLFFDRDLDGADQRALQCQTALLELLRQAKIPLYRRSLLDGPASLDPGVRSIMDTLKTHFDPHHILAPKRYC